MPRISLPPIPPPRQIARYAASDLRLRWADFRGYTPTDRNLYYLCIEIIWAGLAGGALAFNGPFVLRLGGSTNEIGAMVVLPALMTILFSIPAARFLEQRSRQKPLVIGSLALGRAFFLLIALVPAVMPAHLQAGAVVACVTLQAIPIALFNAGFMAMIGDVCPPDRRPSLFAARNVLLAGSVAAGAFLSGLWLERIPFPLNYQTLNVLGFALSEYSTYLVARIEFPVHTPRPAPAGRPHLDWGQVRSVLRERRAYVNINIASLIGGFGAWAAGPLYTVFFVNTLHLGEAWLGTNTTLAQIGSIAGAALWMRLIRRKGTYWVLLRALSMCWIYPIAVVLAPSAGPMLAFGLLTSLNEAGIGLTHFSILLDLCPQERRSSYLAVHTTLMNTGAMIAPLLSVPAANLVGIPAMLVVCGLIRLLGTAAFNVLPIKPEKSV